MKKIDGALDNYICIDAPIFGVALSFSPTSRFWKKAPSYNNSVIITATYNPDATFIDLSAGARNIRTSHSHGGGYLLGWTKKGNAISSKGIRNIISSASSQDNLFELDDLRVVNY